MMSFMVKKKKKYVDDMKVYVHTRTLLRSSSWAFGG